MRLPVRVRTILLILLGSVVPLFLAGIAAAVKIESNLVEEIVEDQRRLIGQIRLDLAAELGWYQRQLETLSARMPIQSLKPEYAQPGLDVFLTFHGVFSSISLYDRKGRLVTDSSRGARSRGADVTQVPPSLRAPVEETLATGKSRMVGAGRDPRVEDIHMICPVPSIREGEPPVAAIVASVKRRSAEIQDLAEDWKFMGGTYVYVTDPAGEVVARAGDLHRKHVHRIRVKNVTPPENEEEIVAGVGELLGRHDVIATASLGDTGLVAVVGRPYSEVDHMLTELLRSVSFYVLVGMLVALLMGVLLSRAIVAPILELTDGIQRVARGEVAHRLSGTQRDELGDAARAFNEMAAQFQKGRLLEEMWRERRAGKPDAGGPGGEER